MIPALEQLWPPEEVEAPEPAPPPRNLAAVLDLGRGSLMWFHGVRMLIPPLPYLLSLEMQALLLELSAYAPTEDGKPELVAITRETLPAYRSCLDRAVRLLEQAVVPLRRSDRIRRRFGRWHPFGAATEAEITALLPFVFGHRTKSAIRLSWTGASAEA